MSDRKAIAKSRRKSQNLSRIKLANSTRIDGRDDRNLPAPIRQRELKTPLLRVEDATETGGEAVDVTGDGYNTYVVVVTAGVMVVGDGVAVGDNGESAAAMAEMVNGVRGRGCGCGCGRGRDR